MFRVPSVLLLSLPVAIATAANVSHTHKTHTAGCEQDASCLPPTSNHTSRHEGNHTTSREKHEHENSRPLWLCMLPLSIRGCGSGGSGIAQWEALALVRAEVKCWP